MDVFLSHSLHFIFVCFFDENKVWESWFYATEDHNLSNKAHTCKSPKLEISSKLACLLWSSTHSGLRLIVRQDLKAMQEKREREREERTESWRRRDQVEVGLRAPYV